MRSLTSSMARDGLKLSRNPPTVTLIVATAVTRAAMADDAAALALLLLLLGASDRADDDEEATHPMVVLLFPRSCDLRSRTTSDGADDDGRLSEEEAEEEATGKKRGPAGPRVVALLRQLWTSRNGLSCRAMLRLQGVYIENCYAARREFFEGGRALLGLRCVCASPLY